MERGKLLVIGGGIGGLTAAIALLRKGFEVDLIERDPNWTVYGVGIIQQSNVIRAMDELGLLDAYLDAGFGFDQVEIYIPTGARVAVANSPKLVDGRPANVGIGRRALHKVLGDHAAQAGARILLGVSAQTIDDRGHEVAVEFSDGSSDRYDAVIGADGIYSTTRGFLFPDAPKPEFTGQSVWRYNFKRPDDVVSLWAFEGRVGIGLVPLSSDLMYMYVTTAEPGNPRYRREGLAAAMRAKLAGTPPRIAELAEQIRDDEEVVYKPLEAFMLEGPWHKGRVGLLGDAVHATTPHLGQGAGMAIEDAIVLADELAAASDFETAFSAYRDRREARCRYIVEQSLAICRGQLGQGPVVDQGAATHAMFKVIAQPI